MVLLYDVFSDMPPHSIIEFTRGTIHKCFRCCFIGDDDDEVELSGTFSLEELQAIVHVMEYDD